MFPGTADLAFRRFQRSRNPAALATVFDRTAKELLGLARHLAPDLAAAEDLVQATFVTAIEAAADYDRDQRVLPWLLGILTNHARAARRRRQRRPDPARLPGEPTGDPGRQAEERELRAELRAAIGRLPEVYRVVLRLHLEQGMSAADIARTLERPGGTVRAQLSRGLQLLRRALPAGLTAGAAIAAAPGRGLQAIREAVLSGPAPLTGGKVAALSTGAILMLHRNLIVALSAALLLLITGAAFLWPQGGDGALRAGDRLTSAVRDGTEAPAAPPVEAPDRRLAEAAPPEAGPVADPEPPGPATGTLRVRLLRAGSGEPAAGVGIALQPLADLQALGRAPRFRPADAAGEVRFEGLLPQSYMIEIDRAGRAAAREVTAGAETLAEITLPAGVTVQGQAIEGSGQPLAGATILLHGSRMGAAPVAVSDAAGRFVLADLAAGVELVAAASGHAPSLAYPVRGAPGSTVELQLVLGDGARRLQGRVLDPKGQPVAEALVAVLVQGALQSHPFDRSEQPRPRALYLRSGKDGGFVCDQAPTEALLVLANAEDGSAPAIAQVEAGRGDAFVDLRLRAGATIAGSIEHDGVPLAGVTVLAFVEEPAQPIGYLGNLLGMRRATTAADGSFAIAGVLPGSVHLRAHLGLDSLGEQRVDVDDGQQVRWDLALGDRPVLRVQVEPATDPLTRAPWLAILQIPARSAVRQGMVRDGVVEFGELPDEECSLLIVRLQQADYVVLARRDGLRAGDEVRLSIPAERLTRCTLRGRAVDRQRAPIRGATLTIQALGDGRLPVLVRRTTGEDGSFRATPLPPGRYRLTLRTADGVERPGPVRTLAPGEDLDLGSSPF